MKRHLARILDRKARSAHFDSITVHAPELARTLRPGNFVLARDPTTFDPYLRRALYPLHIQGDQFQFALAASDPLAARIEIGATLDLLAPLGKPVAFDAAAQHILLAADGAPIAPLIFFARDAIAQGRAVLLITRGDAFPTRHLLPEIEYRARAANETWLDAETIAWADQIIASGSPAAYAQLADTIIQTRYRLQRGFARVWADAPMPCGIGDCWACAVETSRGFALACVDGPFFDLAELSARSRQ